MPDPLQLITHPVIEIADRNRVSLPIGLADELFSCPYAPGAYTRCNWLLTQSLSSSSFSRPKASTTIR